MFSRLVVLYAIDIKRQEEVCKSHKNYCTCGCGSEIRKESMWAKGHNPNKTKDRFDWSNLEQDYTELRTVDKVAEKYGCTAAAVSYQMKKKGIKALHEKPKKEIDNIIKIYEKFGTLEKTAKYLNINKKTVRYRLEDAGYKINHNNKKLCSEVGIGRYGERIALSVLSGSVDMSGKDLHYPYDIEWKGMEIDVKTSRPKQAKRTEKYFFNIKNSKCTHFLFILLDNESEPWKMYLIPSKRFNSTVVYMSGNTIKQYEIYEIEVSSSEFKCVISETESVR